MIIVPRYKAHKDNVIDIFNLYKKYRGAENDGTDIVFLENRIKSLKAGKYTLAIAGEVSSGKSTFINALLGAEVLPADVLQATSAIVEIFKSENSYLKIKFADGRVEEVFDDLTTELIDEAKVRLHQICSLNDEYRDIPTTILDKMIVEREEQIEVDNELINELNEKSGTNLDFAKQSETIKKYISEHNKQNIPKEIEFGYPFRWSFDEFRIVDTPGVNAVGGVQVISHNYLENANAILFVKSIESIESESFKRFVNSTISQKKGKESLFLVLTKIGKDYENHERLYNEAKRLYGDIIQKERILAVDSILSLIYSDLKNGKSVDEIRKSSNDKKPMISIFRDKSEDDNKTFEETVLNCSGFQKMYETIDEFSSIAPCLQLTEILDEIKKGYETQTDQHSEKINRLNQKKQNPQEFEESIKRISEALSEYQELLLLNKRDIERKYKIEIFTSDDRFKEIERVCPKKITQSFDIENARKNLIDAIKALDDFIEDIEYKIKNDFNEKFTQLGKDFKNEYEITLPKIDFNSIEAKAKSNSYRQEDVFVDRNADFWDFITLGIARIFRENRIKVDTKTIYDAEKHLGAYRDECNNYFYKRTGNFHEVIKSFLNKFSQAFEEEVNNVIKERQEALKEEKIKKQTNQEIIDEIDKIELKKKDITPEIRRVIELKENLPC